MLRLPRTAASSPKMFCCASVFLSFSFGLGRTLFSRTVLFCLPHLRGCTTPFSLCCISHIYIYIFQLFLCPFRFSLCQRMWNSDICMPYLSYPVRRHVIPVYTSLTSLVCCISVSWFCDRGACIFLGGRIGTDTGCARCRLVERTV